MLATPHGDERIFAAGEETALRPTLDSRSFETGGNPRTPRFGKRATRSLLAAGLFLVAAVVFLCNTGVERTTYSSLVARSRTLIGDYSLGEWPGDEPNATESGDARPACRIPQLDPWDDSVRPYVKRPKPYSCPSPPPLTHLTPAAPAPPPSNASSPAPPPSNASSIVVPLPFPPLIRIDPALAAKYGNVTDGELKCCASTVTRGKVTSKKDVRADQSYRFEKCRDFNDTINVNSDFTLVECKRGKKTVHTDMHSTVVPTKETWRKMADARHPLPPSVMLLGLDSSSRLNIHRAAPKLMAALEEVGAVEMTAYNKVGDNTLPNLLPILAGVSLSDANNKTNETRKSDGRGCWLNNKYTFDECPFIWRNFSRKGYVTMFGEDEPTISIFNYHKHGFREQPTDHYLRPFYVVAEKRLKKTTRASASWCYADKATLTRVLEYTRSFVDTYERRAPFFSIVFITGIGHQNAADIELGDAELAEFVRHVVNVSDGGLDQGGGGLFLAVFSDHGMRWGKLRQSPFGWLEERVPFIFIRPPFPSPETPRKWHLSDSANLSRVVRDLYPNLVTNRNRLTSPFDFYNTLYALLNGKGTHPSRSSCAECYDLLHDVVPLERTCADAAIPDNWCACADDEESTVERETFQKASSVAVAHLNKVLSDAPQCSQLAIGSTISAKYRVLPTTNKKKKLRFVVVTFTTVPGEAVFEATVLMKEKGAFQVSSDLSRLNQYGNQSWCVDDADKKLYCYCY